MEHGNRSCNNHNKSIWNGSLLQAPTSDPTDDPNNGPVFDPKAIRERVDGDVMDGYGEGCGGAW